MVKPSKSGNKPADFIIDKDETFIQLDDINVRLKKLLDSQNNIEKILMQNEKIQVEMYKCLKGILKEAQDEAEEGESITFSGTASTTTFNIVDIETLTGTKARGYTLINEGPTNIYYLHSTNAIPDITYTESDTTKTNTKFDILAANEEIEYKGNRKRIVAIYVLAVTGTPSFKAQIVW